jgi:hypothetical protein
VSIPCPSCGCGTPNGTLCVDCSAAVATMLAAAPQLIDQLEVAVTKQAKVSSGGKAGKGSAHLRSPVNWGVAAVRDALLVELALWGDDLDAIRRHPQAADIVSGIGRAVKAAFRAIDRMQERQYLGTCLASEDGGTCHAELWVRPGAHQLTCTQCGTTHDVPARRADLIEQASDMLVTVREASRYMGEVGGIPVGQERIAAYLRWNRIMYAPGTEKFRLGDLLRVVISDSEKRSA